jgi:hypothetical protein
MVICSRVTDYETIGTQLRLQGAIIVQPLTREQAEFYLRRGGEELAAVRQTLRDDPTYWELLDTPLMLNIMTLAYTGQPVTALQTYGTLEERRHHVFDKYIVQMFRRRSFITRYSTEQTIRWLTWLAHQVLQHSQTVFYIEWLQPDWLPVRKQRMTVRAIGVTVSVLSVGLIFGLGYGLLHSPEAGLSIGLIGGLIFGLLIVCYCSRRSPVETLHWSWSGVWAGMARGLLYGFGSGLLLGLIMMWMSKEFADTWRIGGMSFGLFGGLFGGLSGGLVGGEVAIRSVPNEGIYRTAWNAILSGLGVGLVIELICIPIFWKTPGYALMFGLSGGLVAALIKGGYTTFQHFILRLVLFTNDLAPWRYIDFLDFAAERILLRKVGGGYMFIHRYLLEYFASLDDESKAEVESKG